jgi:hypothetical protein
LRQSICGNSPFPENLDLTGIIVEKRIRFGADFKDRFSVVRFGLNYKLGGGDIISSRY